MTDRLYLVTRHDLPPGQQAVQAAHALQEYNVLFPDAVKNWHSNSNTLVLLEVENEASLRSLVEKCLNYKVALFREPDRDNELTAIAVEHEGQTVLKELRLALL